MQCGIHNKNVEFITNWKDNGIGRIMGHMERCKLAMTKRDRKLADKWEKKYPVAIGFPEA